MTTMFRMMTVHMMMTLTIWMMETMKTETLAHTNEFEDKQGWIHLRNHEIRAKQELIKQSTEKQKNGR